MANTSSICNSLHTAFNNFREKICFQIINGEKHQRKKIQPKVIERFIEDNENIIRELNDKERGLSAKCYEKSVRLFKEMKASGKDGIKFARQFSELIEDLLSQILTLEIDNQNLQSQLQNLFNNMDKGYDDDLAAYDSCQKGMYKCINMYNNCKHPYY